MARVVDTLRGLSDGALLCHLKHLVANERHATVSLIASIAEFDVRRLYLSQGFPSLYEYCVGHLHLSEYAAYSRIQAARLSRRFPVVLELLEAGDVSLTALTVLGPYFNESNYLELLREARNRRKPELEEIAARLKPKPPVASTIRRAPTPVTSQAPMASILSDTPTLALGPPQASVPAAPAVHHARNPVIKPLAPEIYKVSFTLSREGRDNLRRAQDLLRHSIPNGDAAHVFERALCVLVADLEKKKFALVSRPRDSRKQKQTTRAAADNSRLIPAAVRRDVWRRDKGRCAFVGVDGRCRERGFLELHHVKPFAAGGHATAENIELRCRAHNGHEADVFFAASRAP